MQVLYAVQPLAKGDVPEADCAGTRAPEENRQALCDRKRHGREVVHGGVSAALWDDVRSPDGTAPPLRDQCAYPLCPFTLQSRHRQYRRVRAFRVGLLAGWDAT